MVAANNRGDVLPHPFGDGVGIGSVPHHIATAQDPVVFAFGVFQNGLESLPIRVNIAEDQEAHRRTTAISGGAPSRTGTPMVPSPEPTQIELLSLR